MKHNDEIGGITQQGKEIKLSKGAPLSVRAKPKKSQIESK